MAKMGERGFFPVVEGHPLRTSEHATGFFNDILNTSIRFYGQGIETAGPYPNLLETRSCP